MINLLPIAAKKQIQREYILRVVIISCSAILISIIIGAILLFPSYIISRARESGVERELSIMKQSEGVAEEQEIRRAFDETMQILSVLNTQTSTPLYEVFTAVIGHKPNGVSIKGMVLQRGVADSGSSIAINGLALRRGDLLSFSRALEDDTLFAEVVLPVSNLARDRDITFTLNLNGSF